MIACLHPSTVGTSLDLPEYLRLAQESGFTLADWDASDIQRRVAQSGLESVQKLFREAHVRWAGFGLPLDLFADDVSFESALGRLPDLARIAQQFGATRAMTWLWPSVDIEPVPLILQIIQRSRRIADILADFGLRFGIEFVGPHHLRNRAYPLLYRLPDLLALIDAIDRSNVGVLLDTYHWYTSESTLDELRRLPASKIVEVHINDATLGPREAHDQDRSLPGEGRIDLVGFCQVLAAGGYDGPLSLEILRRTAPDEPPAIVAQKAYDALTTIITRAVNA